MKQRVKQTEFWSGQCQNKNLLTITMESKTKTTPFTIGYKKSNLQKN